MSNRGLQGHLFRFNVQKIIRLIQGDAEQLFQDETF